MSLELLFTIHNKQLQASKTKLQRYLYNQINWEERLNILAGARGVGKTTLILQYLKKHFNSTSKALWISADNIVVNKFGLFEIAYQFDKLGGQYLAIDEVHKYPGWQQEVKNIYDSFPTLNLFLSGSSAIDIIKGQYDLSRRPVLYKLKGLSFREYLNFSLKQQTFSTFKLEDILKNHVELTNIVINELSKHDMKIIPMFNDYLKNGYYPYFLQGIDKYFLKLTNTIKKILYEDIPSAFKVNREAINYMQKMIYIVATSAPFSPNITGLASDLGISKDSVYLYLDYLEKAEVFNFLYRGESGTKIVRKPEKIYLENTNLFYAIETETFFATNMGAIREAFVLNQLQDKFQIVAPVQGDFEIDQKYLFEIGGPRKDILKVQTDKEIFTLKDGIEFGAGNIVPLWLLGFLY